MDSTNEVKEPEENEQPGENDDLTLLSNLDGDILLSHVKIRFNEDKIYTYIGDILISVNPFCNLPIYSATHQAIYTNQQRMKQPPHIFSIADTCYQRAVSGFLVNKKKTKAGVIGVGGGGDDDDNLDKEIVRINQCVIVSGESGAGKTEATKLIIKQIIYLTKDFTQLEMQIVAFNPLLESFGNALTLMNDNSSRFGKYISLKFVEGKIFGAYINVYLLEKSRVVYQNEGEENFHIFYYMLSSPEMREKYSLKDTIDSYTYLRNVTELSKDTEYQRTKLQELQDSMDLVGFLDAEQSDIFQILAGCLQLGNIPILENPETGYALLKKTDDDLQLSCMHLGLNAAELADVLLSNATKTKAELITKNYTHHQAITCRDAIAKLIYARLFLWIVCKINEMLGIETQNTVANRSSSSRSTTGGEKERKTILERNKINNNNNNLQSQEIGILDIFGFEHFQLNSFEQACINLANEQLQFFFNRHVFSLEQDAYRKEGLTNWVDIEFVNNQPVLDLFCMKATGILSVLNDICKLSNCNDNSFVEKLYECNKTNDLLIKGYKKSAGGNMSFTVKHYAGNVEYCVDNWAEKNKDTIPNGINQLLMCSSHPLLQLIFNTPLTETGCMDEGFTNKEKKFDRSSKFIAATESRKRKLTVATQFTNSLNLLLERMTISQPIFVRCIKPNYMKSSKVFIDEFVKAQLLYTGILETTKIRRNGYAVRMSFIEFIDTYKIFFMKTMKNINFDMENRRKTCEEILNRSGLKGWQLGKSKVFLKLNHVEFLSNGVNEINENIIKIQKFYRGHLGRKVANKTRQEYLKRFSNFFETICKYQYEKVKKITLIDLEREVIKQEKILKEKIEEELRQKKKLEEEERRKKAEEERIKNELLLKRKQEIERQEEENRRRLEEENKKNQLEYEKKLKLEQEKQEKERLRLEKEEEIKQQQKAAEIEEKRQKLLKIEEEKLIQLKKKQEEDAKKQLELERQNQISREKLEKDHQLYENSQKRNSLSSSTQTTDVYTEARNQTIRWFLTKEKSRIPRNADGTFPNWFHGLINRRDAVKLLNGKPNGCFLIRLSETSCAYTLTFQCLRNCKNYKIDLTRNLKYTIRGEHKTFQNLKLLVDFYQNHFLSNCNITMLTNPCDRVDRNGEDLLG